MAISKQKKQAQVAELVGLFSSAKIIVTAKYTGLSVQDLQELRQAARAAGVVIKVVKNRLVRIALQQSELYKSADTSELGDQLLYAFGFEDELAPPQVLARFAKSRSNLKLATGFSQSAALDNSAITQLANLPSLDQLRGQLVSVFAAPLGQLLSVASAPQRGLAQVLSQRATAT